MPIAGVVYNKVQLFNDVLTRLVFTTTTEAPCINCPCVGNDVTCADKASLLGSVPVRLIATDPPSATFTIPVGGPIATGGKFVYVTSTRNERVAVAIPSETCTDIVANGVAGVV